MVKVRRVYEPPRKDDGFRVLVDRLWPRGLKKGRAALDLWAKDIAPSSELRMWFAHDPGRWPEFARRFKEELAVPAAREVLEDLARRAAAGTVTILHASREERYNNAAVVKGAIEDLLRKERRVRKPAAKAR